MDSKPTEPETPVSEELNITVKKVDTPKQPEFSAAFEEVSPLEMSIEETLKFRADERRRKLKEFNYKFHNHSARIDEIEREPAYKRAGVDISSKPAATAASRMSLGPDSNDDLQL